MREKLLKEIHSLYENYNEIPYISDDRNLEEWLAGYRVGKNKLVPKRNMERTDEGLLAGHIIYLWLINFGTHTTENWVPKYFEYTYGVNGILAKENLLEENFIVIQSAYQSLAHVSAVDIKNILKEYGVKGFSGKKKEELVEMLKEHFTEEQLSEKFQIRGYELTEKGKAALENNQNIVDKHPKKKF